MKILFALVSLCLFAGCSTTPYPWETRHFDIQTNVTPVVVSTTNATPEGTVVTIKTNYVVEYVYNPNTNTVAIAQASGAIAQPFGFGGLVTTGLLGLSSIWAALRSRRNAKVAAGLAQGLEVASEILRTTPQGNVLDEKLKSWLQNNQVETGTINAVIVLLNKVVDNGEARKVAEQLQKEIASRTTPPV